MSRTPVTYQGQEYRSIAALLRSWTGEDKKAFNRAYGLYQRGYTFDAIRAALKMPSGELQSIRTSICNRGHWGRERRPELDSRRK